MDELRRVILDYVTREYLEEGDDRVVGVDTPLISSGIVDSFSMVSLKLFLERRYSLRIPDADASTEAFDSVERIAGLVERLGGVPQPASAGARREP